MVGQKKSGKLWALGKEGIKEVDEYKYLGVWMNRQVTGHNHVNHLEGKALGLQNLARGGKFWRYEGDIKAGLMMWEVGCKLVLSGLGPSETHEKLSMRKMCDSSNEKQGEKLFLL